MVHSECAHCLSRVDYWKQQSVPASFEDAGGDRGIVAAELFDRASSLFQYRVFQDRCWTLEIELTTEDRSVRVCQSEYHGQGRL